MHKRGEDKLTSITASDCELSRKAGAVMDAGSEAQGSKVDVETRLGLAAMVQTVVSQEVGVRDGEQATIVLHRIVINPEMEHTGPQAGTGLFFCIKRSDHAKNFV